MNEEQMPKMSAEEALAMIGLTADDIDEADVALAEQRKINASINRHVCACGHAMSRHTVVSGIVMCKPARMECPCKRSRPVLLAQDTRLFIRKTEGGGAAHVDDGPALFEHVRHGGARQEEGRFEVHLDDDVPVRLGHLLAAPAPQ